MNLSSPDIRLLFTILLSFKVFILNAATVQIGSGSSTSKDVPIEVSSDYNFSQQIITSHEYLAQGSAGNITKIRFKCMSSIYTNELPNWNYWTIYMGHTTKDEFINQNDWVPITNMNQVFSGQVTPVTGNWFEITLNTPFNYNGSDNIVFAINETSSGDGSGTEWAAYEDDNDKYRSLTINAFNPINPNNLSLIPAHHISSQLAQVQFEGSPASCLGPSDLNVIYTSHNSSIVNWIENGTSNNWEVSFGGTGFNPNAGTIQSANTNQLTINGLSPSSTYEFYVRSNCGSSNYSTWVGPYTIQTSCNPTTLPFSENFNSGILPNCWRKYTSYYYESAPFPMSFPSIWEFNEDATYSHSGNGGKTAGEFAIISSVRYDTMDATLESPLIDLSTVSNPMLEFDWFSHTHPSYSVFNILKVQVFDGSNWVTLGSYTGSDPNWITEQVNLIPYSNLNTKIRFVLNSAERNYYYVGDILLDNVSIVSGPSCWQPQTLNASNVTYTTADITWNSISNANSYDIEVVEGNNPFTGTPTHTSVTNSLNLTGLIQDENYRVYIRSNCGGGDISSWSLPLSFKTGYCVGSMQLSGQYIEQITSTGAVTNVSYNTSSSPTNDFDDETSQLFEAYEAQTITFNSSYNGTGSNSALRIWVDWNQNFKFDSTELEYSEYGSDSKVSPIVVPSGITTGNYRVRLRASYAPENALEPCNELDFGSTVDFNLTIVPPATCLDPSYIEVSSITDSSAQISWTENGAASSWEIEYGPEGFSQGNGTVITTSSNPYDLNGLNAIADYDFYIRSNCGSGDYGSWLGPYNFFTDISPLNCSTGSIDTIAFEEFENSLPSGWSISQNFPFWDWHISSSGATTGPYSGHNNPGFMRFIGSNNTPSASDTLSSPSILIPNSSSNARLSFYYYMYGDFVGTLKVRVSNDQGNTWTNLFTKVGQQQSSTSEPWAPADIDISQYTGDQIIVQFIGINTGTNGITSDDITIDDFLVEVCTTCPMPIDFHVENNSSNTISLDWTPQGNETNWIVEYGPGGFTPGTGTLMNTNTHPLQITGLNPLTNYHFYLKADCGGTNSGIVGPLSMSTLLVSNYTCDAVEVAVDGNDNQFYNNNATLQSGENSSLGYHTAWFKFIAPNSGNLEINTCWTGFDNSVNLYKTQDCQDYNNFVLLDSATSNPFPSCGGSHVAGLNACGLTPGETYYISVGSVVPGNTGGFNLKLTPLASQFAGNDSSIVVCSSDSLTLSNLLTGADTGGIWTDLDNTGNVNNGVFSTAGLNWGNYNFIYTITNGICPTDTSNFTVTISDCLGIDDFVTDKFKIFPNPTNGTFYLVSTIDANNAVVEIMDLQGKIISSEQMNIKMGAQYDFNLGQLERGVYLIKVATEKNMTVKRVILQR